MFGAAGGFAFKAANSSTSETTSSYKFGVTATTATAITTCGANSAPAFPGISGGFQFGRTTEAAASNVAVSSTQGAGGFQFGQSAVTTVSSLLNASTTQPALGGFQFGKALASSAANESCQATNGAGASVTSGTQPAASSSAVLPSGGFSFGSSNSTQSSSKTANTASFTFGQGANTSEVKTSAAFSFGSRTSNASPSIMTSPGKPEVAVSTNLFKVGAQSSVGGPSVTPVQTLPASLPVTGSFPTSAGSGQTPGQFAGFGFSTMSSSATTLTNSFSSSVSKVATALTSAEAVGVPLASSNTNVQSNVKMTTAETSAGTQPSSVFLFGQAPSGGFQKPLGVPAVTTNGFQFSSSLSTAGMLDSLSRSAVSHLRFYHAKWF